MAVVLLERPPIVFQVIIICHTSYVTPHTSLHMSHLTRKHVTRHITRHTLHLTLDHSSGPVPILPASELKSLYSAPCFGPLPPIFLQPQTRLKLFFSEQLRNLCRTITIRLKLLIHHAIRLPRCCPFCQASTHRSTHSDLNPDVSH
jgi:hypothetical protein